MLPTIYADVLGSDSLGDGSAAMPYLTIQRAITRALQLQTPCKVQVGAGNFAGYDLQNVQIPLPSDVISGAQLTLSGTWGPFTPAAGPQSGLVTAASAGGSAPAIIEDNTATWAAGALKGKVVKVNSTVRIPIEDNDATHLKLTPGVFPNGVPAIGSTYSIEDALTVINTPAPAYPVCDFGTASPVNNSAAGIRITNCQGPNNTICVQAMKIALTTNNTGIVVSNSNVLLQNILITNPGATTAGGLSVSNGSSLAIRYSYINQPGTGARILPGGGQARPPSGLTIQSCVLDGGAYGILGAYGGLVISGTLIRNATTGGFAATGQTTVQFVNTIIDNCNNGVYVPENFSSGPINVALGFNDVVIQNCAAAGLDLEGAMVGAYCNQLAGSGNGIGVNLQRGAFAAVKVNVNITGTIELQIDGSASTWAAMRAFVPPIQKDANFDTRAYTLP